MPDRRCTIEYALRVVTHSSTLPPGTVLDQRPDGGMRVDPSRTVTLIVATIPPGVFHNPWGFEFTGSRLVYRPPGDFCSYFACITSFWSGRGYVVQCVDGWFSRSGGISGACSYHGGESRPLYAP